MMPWLNQLQSARWGEASCIAFCAYMLGCFAAGYYLVRWRTGQDIRALGSGSVGARNVGRVLGRGGFTLTVLADALKGLLAVAAARWFAHDDRMVEAALLGVVAGHIWPAQLGFQGGKGVATSLGALLVYDFHLAGAFLLLFAAAALLFRKSVPACLFAFAALPLVSLYLRPEARAAAAISLALLAALVLIAHRKNLLAEFSHFAERRHLHPK
jgi:glycerol-3-phosphate acyltransferase PlsY